MIREFIIITSLVFASYKDLKTGLVDDALITFLLVTGAYLAFLGGYLGFASKLGLIIFLVGVFYNKLGLVGGGDVKLLSVIPLFLPIEAIGISIFFVGIAVISSIYDIAKHGFKYESKARFTWVILLGTILLIMF